MNLKTLFTLSAVVTILFGLGFTFAPEPLTALYGAQLTQAGIYVGQLFGSVLIGLAVIAWYARSEDRSTFLNAVLLAFFITDLLGFLLSLWVRLGGVVNELGWSSVVLYGLFTIGFGYFRFVKSGNE